MSRAGVMGFGKALALLLVPALICVCISWMRIYSTVARYDWNYVSSWYYDVDGPTYIDEPTGPSSFSAWTEEYSYDFDWFEGMLALFQMAIQFFVFFLFLYGRKKLRAVYNIQGTSCSDCMVWWLCSPCALAQEAMHVDTATGYA
jgi:Cys-rich protein (TIGR01571 family)